MLRNILAPAWMFPSAVVTSGTLMGAAAAYLGDHLHDSDGAAGVSSALIEQRFLVSLGGQHQVIEVVLARVLLEKVQLWLQTSSSPLRRG